MLAILLPLLVGMALLLALLRAGPYERTETRGGVWDLRGLNLHENSYRLTGEVAYVPNALLTPEAFAASEDIAYGFPHESEKVYTARMRILLPEDGSVYALLGRTGAYAGAVYVNGLWLTQAGTPAPDAADAVSWQRTVQFTVPDTGGEVEILLQVANHAHRIGESPAGFIIGTEEHVTRIEARQAYPSLLTMGCFLLLFVVHLLLYLLLPAYRANLWFSLLSLLWFVRSGVTGGKPLLLLSPLTWTAALRIEYITIALALLLYALLMNDVFPGAYQRFFLPLTAACAAAFTALFILPDTVTMTGALLPLELYIVSGILYTAVRIAMKTRRPGTDQVIMILGAGVLFFGVVWDVLYYQNLIKWAAFSLLEYMMLAYCLFQMTAMFVGTMERLRQAEAREAQLAMENAALARVDRLRADMMHTVSHELKTPLAVMMGYAQLVVAELADLGVPPQSTRDLDAIAQEAQRLAHIVEEIQGLASAQAEKRRGAVSLAQVAGHIARLYRPILQRKRTALQLDIAPALPAVWANAGELTQVLFNLLTNAGRHAEGGTITIAAAQAGACVTVTVADTGDGINPDFLPHALERHTHADEGGTGLGLSICKEIIEAYGGEIRLESAPGEGTRVTFTLPVAPKEHDDG